MYLPSFSSNFTRSHAVKCFPYIPRAYINLDRICHNYRLMVDTLAAHGHNESSRAVSIPDRNGNPMEVTWPPMLAVVKADAYGHGHIRVARALLEGEGARFFASGSVFEASELRRGLDKTMQGPSSTPLILSLLGLVGPEDLELCLANGIIPVIHTFEQLPLLAALKRPMAVAIKCNTGMARLGFGKDDMPQLIERLRALPNAVPVLVLSHLACADSAEGADCIRTQATIFAGMLAALRSVWPDLAASLCNSAGILQATIATGIIGEHICRAGVTLYGGNPLYDTSLASLGDGLQPSMEVSAPIIALRTLVPGEGLGYGHTFVAWKNMRIGIVAIGYSHYLTRSLSNRGSMCVGGVRASILGRISMEMTAIDLSEAPEDITVGDLAWVLGGPDEAAVTVEELATVWGTITYEVFCQLGSNPRCYAGLEE